MFGFGTKWTSDLPVCRWQYQSGECCLFLMETGWEADWGELKSFGQLVDRVLPVAQAAQVLHLLPLHHHPAVVQLVQLELQFRTDTRFIVSVFSGWTNEIRNELIDLNPFLCACALANGNTSQCLTVANGYAAVGTVVNM